MTLERSSRNGSAAYIDTQTTQPLADLNIAGDASSVASGSSIAEDSEQSSDQVAFDDDGPRPQGASLLAHEISPPDEDSTSVHRLDEFAYLDERTQRDEADDNTDESDWAVDDEDWELADGDFTKQYNRLRQQRDAQQPQAGPSNSRLDKTLLRTVRAPLPARNHNAIGKQGVALNPKAVLRSNKDKSDRATQEQVLDPRTRLVLSGLVNRGIIGSIERCISTGKEANVYHALASDNPPPVVTQCREMAVKIYRTSILSFRARQAYIVGEHRFKGEYSSSRNARKMVRVWAEKELRNLRRLEQYGVRAPRVIEGKENVLVMEYLGSELGAAPRLKDADIPSEDLDRLYIELLVAMRRMYRQCKLVHGDLSEYNILYHDSHLYIIDVSQSVEHDHPKTFDFLRTDIRNVEDYFKRRSVGDVRTLGPRRTWEFVVSESVGLDAGDELGEEGEQRLAKIVTERLQEDRDEADDAVFMSSFIPRTLGEVYDPERDAELVNAGRGDELIYAKLTGLDGADAVADPQQDALLGDPTMREPADSQSAESEGDEANDGSRQPRGFRNEDKDAKKERKKAVKEAKREQRQHKMPKAEKKRLVKKTAG